MLTPLQPIITNHNKYDSWSFFVYYQLLPDPKIFPGFPYLLAFLVPEDRRHDFSQAAVRCKWIINGIIKKSIRKLKFLFTGFNSDIRTNLLF